MILKIFPDSDLIVELKWSFSHIPNRYLKRLGCLTYISIKNTHKKIMFVNRHTVYAWNTEMPLNSAC